MNASTIPLESQGATAQLEFWRLQALHRIEQLLRSLQGEATAVDGAVDDLIRHLNQLPKRPADRPPYQGIFAVTDVAAGRQKAVERFQRQESNVQGALNETDALIDDTLRLLTQLPPRPADKAPYASLFAVAKRLLTPAHLLAMSPTTDPAQATRLVPYLNWAMFEFQITTPLRQAHFLAQVAHESDRFRALEEYASGQEYEWREDLGNVNGGDGVRFKGRGLIQITGRTNYRAVGAALKVDLINNPGQLAEPDLACRSAGWFWDDRKLNPDADRDDIYTITRVINGGLNGLDDRMALFDAAWRVIKDM